MVWLVEVVVLRTPEYVCRVAILRNAVEYTKYKLDLNIYRKYVAQ